jgi:hypothetical protein
VYLIPHSGSKNSGNEKQWTSFFSSYRTYVSLYYNEYLWKTSEMGPILALIAPSPLVNLLIAYISGMKDTTDTARYASYLDLHLTIDSEGHVSVFASSAVDCGFESWSGQTKDHKISICCFSTKYAALGKKSKDGLARNQGLTAGRWFTPGTPVSTVTI